MKRVSAIVFHNDFKTIEKMTIRYNDNFTLVDLIDNTKFNKPYIYEHFNDLYGDCLSIIKEHQCYCKYYNAFGAKWYDIIFINVHHPFNAEHYPYKEKIKKTEGDK